MVDVKTLVDTKISEDTEFQTSLEELSEEDKEQAISEKRETLIAAEFAKAEELANNQKIRAEKAEALAKQLKKPEEKPETPKNSGLDLKDIRALQDVHDDDVDEVVEFAKFKGITIAEAKKLPAIQSLLRTNEEDRKVKQTTIMNKGGGRTSKITGQTLLEKAYETGETPTNEADIKALVQARIQEQLDKRKS